MFAIFFVSSIVVPLSEWNNSLEGAILRVSHETRLKEEIPLYVYAKFPFP